MGWLSRLLGGDAAVDDEPVAEQRASVLKMLESMRNVKQQMGVHAPTVVLPVDADEVPQGSGEFGRSPSNPIPVNGVEGERVYLQRLTSSDGQRLLYHRLGSVKSPCAIEGVVDEYEVVTFDGMSRLCLYFDMYYPRRSRRAPSGFSLRPWRTMSDFDKLMAKLGACGVNSRLERFPEDLPAALREHFTKAGLPAQAVEKMLVPLAGIVKKAASAESRQRPPNYPQESQGLLEIPAPTSDAETSNADCDSGWSRASAHGPWMSGDMPLPESRDLDRLIVATLRSVALSGRDWRSKVLQWTKEGLGVGLALVHYRHDTIDTLFVPDGSEMWEAVDASLKLAAVTLRANESGDPLRQVLGSSDPLREFSRIVQEKNMWAMFVPRDGVAVPLGDFGAVCHGLAMTYELYRRNPAAARAIAGTLCSAASGQRFAWVSRW